MTAVGHLETFPALSRMSVAGGQADIRGTTQSKVLSMKRGRVSSPGEPPLPCCMSHHSHADIILAHWEAGINGKPGNSRFGASATLGGPRSRL